MMEPITGILLSPYAGFLATLLGVMVEHSIRYRGIYEFLFTLGAPFGSMISGLFFVGGRWKHVLGYIVAWACFLFRGPPILWNVECAFGLGCLIVIMPLIAKKRNFGS